MGAGVVPGDYVLSLGVVDDVEQFNNKLGTFMLAYGSHFNMSVII